MEECVGAMFYGAATQARWVSQGGQSQELSSKRGTQGPGDDDALPRPPPVPARKSAAQTK